MAQRAAGFRRDRSVCEVTSGWRLTAPDAGVAECRPPGRTHAKGQREAPTGGAGGALTPPGGGGAAAAWAGGFGGGAVTPWAAAFWSAVAMVRVTSGGGSSACRA